MATVTINASMPLEYVQAFLQAIRSFETLDPQRFERCGIVFKVHAPEASADHIKEILAAVTPPYGDLRTLQGDGVMVDEEVAKTIARMHYEKETGSGWQFAPRDPGLDPKWRAKGKK